MGARPRHQRQPWQDLSQHRAAASCGRAHLDGAKPHQAVARLRDALRAAGGVFFATPEYNSSVPGGLKNAIDWKILAAAGARVIDGEVALGHAMDRFDENGRLNDENLEDEVREVVRTLLAEAGSGSPSALLPELD